MVQVNRVFNEVWVDTGIRYYDHLDGVVSCYYVQKLEGGAVYATWFLMISWEYVNQEEARDLLGKLAPIMKKLGIEEVDSFTHDNFSYQVWRDKYPYHSDTVFVRFREALQKTFMQTPYDNRNWTTEENYNRYFGEES